MSAQPASDTAALPSKHEKTEGLPVELVLTIDPETKARLGAELVEMPSPYLHLEEVLLRIEPVFARLPIEIRRVIKRFANDPTAPGGLLIKNLPTDPTLPETPPLGKRPQGKATFVSEACALGVGQLIGGQLFSYAKEKDAELVHQLAPVRGREDAYSNESSRIDFGPHTECGALPVVPTFLALYCLRADSAGAAATYFVEARDMCARVDPRDLEALREPRFQMQIPKSFENADEWSPPQAIVRGPESMPELWYDRDGIRGVDEAAQRVLDRLNDLAKDPSIQRGGVLSPGDLVALDNRKTVHGRRPFTPKYDGRDRWLHRIYLRNDVWAGRAIAGASRVV